MAKFKEKNKALQLRTQGMSIGDIAQRLEVSKSTVSLWCKDIFLSDAALRRIAQKGKTKSTLALLRYSESLRQKRKAQTESSFLIGKKKIGRLSNRDIYCIGLGLYWGEGYKKGSQEFGFTNSDPFMVLFYLRWLSVVFGVQKSELILRVSINEMHKNRIAEVEQYWSHITAVPLRQFTQSSLIRTRNRKIYTNNNHMGTLRIKVRRGTNWRREILGSIQAIVQQN